MHTQEKFLVDLGEGGAITLRMVAVEVEEAHQRKEGRNQAEVQLEEVRRIQPEV